MKKGFLLLLVMLMLCVPAMAEQGSELDGTWVYAETYDEAQMRDGELSLFQQKYPDAQVEIRIEGKEVRIRAHLPYVSWFHLELNEETGWFERTGTLEGDLLAVDSAYTGRKREKDGSVTRKDAQETARFQVRTEDGKLVLTEKKTGAYPLVMTFEKSDTGLTFDASALYGSWRYTYSYRGRETWYFNVPFGRDKDNKAIEYFELAHTYLYITDGRVAIGSDHGIENVFSEKGKYGMDAEEVTVKEGGLFINLRGMRMKLFVNQQGMLRVVPLFNESMKDLMVWENNADLTGQETMDFVPAWGDFFSDTPSLPQGTYYLRGISGRSAFFDDEKSWEKHSKKAAEIVKRCGFVTVTENAIAIEVDGKEISAPWSFPDLYKTPVKSEHAFLSFKVDGYNFVLTPGNDDAVLRLLVSYKKEQFTEVYIYPLGGESGPAGEYYAFDYVQDGERKAAYSTLTLDEQGNITQVIGGETRTGKLAAGMDATLADTRCKLEYYAREQALFIARYDENGMLPMEYEFEYYRNNMSDDVRAVMGAVDTACCRYSGAYSQAGGTYDLQNLYLLAVSGDKNHIILVQYGEQGHVIRELPILRAEGDVIYVDIDGQETAVFYQDNAWNLRQDKTMYVFRAM